MTTVVTDNLDEHTILSLTVSTLANVYCERPTPVAKLNRNVFCEEFDDIKHSHQYTRNLHSFILSRCGYIFDIRAPSNKSSEACTNVRVIFYFNTQIVMRFVTKGC